MNERGNGDPGYQNGTRLGRLAKLAASSVAQGEGPTAEALRPLNERDLQRRTVGREALTAVGVLPAEQDPEVATLLEQHRELLDPRMPQEAQQLLGTSDESVPQGSWGGNSPSAKGILGFRPGPPPGYEQPNAQGRIPQTREELRVRVAELNPSTPRIPKVPRL